MTLPLFPSEKDAPIDRKVPELPNHLKELVALLPLDVPVHTSTLEKAYGRTNYARRIQKIVAEYGWQIDRARGRNGANDDWYTRKSEGPIRPARIRREVGPKLRTEVYERDEWVCQMCRCDVSPYQKTTNPQCDHKVPAERGGPSMPLNLQTLCVRCNLKKGQACRLCELPNCAGCPYAFPEQFGTMLVIRLPNELATKLTRMADQSGTPPNSVIMRLIDEGWHLLETKSCL